MIDPRFLTEPWIFGCPDGIQSDLHAPAELETAWEAMQGRIKALEAELRQARDVARTLTRRMKTTGCTDEALRAIADAQDRILAWPG